MSTTREGAPAHGRYETLLVKAADGLLGQAEQAELEAHLEQCAACREELRDFHLLKETTDAMVDRILADAAIEPPREPPRVRAKLNLAFVLVLGALVLLFGYAVVLFFADPKVPLLLRLALGAGGLGALILFVHVLRLRLRSVGRDPYDEVDR